MMFFLRGRTPCLTVRRACAMFLSRYIYTRKIFVVSHPPRLTPRSSIRRRGVNRTKSFFPFTFIYNLSRNLHPHVNQRKKVLSVEGASYRSNTQERERERKIVLSRGSC